MILAAGLTPAWQQILLLEALRPGEVNRAREVHWCASGNVLNVGIALGHLGATSKTLSLVGGTTGTLVQDEFRSLDLPARWVQCKSPTRGCTTILDTNAGTTTELVENTAPADAAELDAFRVAFRDEASRADAVVLSGSLPAATPGTYYRDLLNCTSARAVLDVRGPELLEALECRPFLVKPNREELGRTVGSTVDTDDALLAAMRDLNRRGAEWVVVTQGRGPVWVTSPAQTFRLLPPAARVVNPIGCGDSMAAGIAWGIQQGRTPLDAVRLGMGAAAANLSQLLPARLDPEAVASIAESIPADEI